ncbi:hypothetical protein SAMN05421774_10847 [Gemmobacter megaterium]|uniref:Uncharacterized protein n=1 Tax=Gemmobacter megaterium TaxID=1086013 RepID=A0A1N7QAP7_9RHOB|nr:hypothetical protein [Gemmobacter megaterium]GGE24428.1 hypothetical protein GCM10011345_33000 [Gemmobacter megaterium]SIT19884.1 hypothetical protein SAMN05421774_10847 [Gemmobacter megaterium]
MSMFPARAAFVAILLSATTSGQVSADHWRQTADPQVVQALSELAMVYGTYCQMGNPQACQAHQAVQQEGLAMLNAGYDCQVQGNQQACAYYQNAYGQLVNTYQQVQGMVQQPMAPGVNPLGATHGERMGAIQQWGQDRMQWGQDRMRQMDADHERFMQTLRN